jgi:hypothetical protein
MRVTWNFRRFQMANRSTPEGNAGSADIQFSTGIVADTSSGAVIHDNESFRVQWSAQNVGGSASPAFTDLLVISSVPEGCPGDSSKDHPVVFNSDRDADNPGDFSESPLNPGQAGSELQPSVGPFPAGSYLLTVTLGNGMFNTTSFICIDIVPA